MATRVPEPGEELVIVDPGGPGFDPSLSTSRFDALGLPAWLRERPVLVTRERWASEAADGAACWDALAERLWSQRLHAGGGPFACEEMPVPFHPPGALSEAVTLLGSGFEAGQITVVGFSFGALRVGAETTAAGWSGEWRVLIADPAPPPAAMRGPDVVASRLGKGVEMLELEAASCDDGRCGDALSALMRQLPTRVDGRSIELTDVDVALALTSAPSRSPEWVQSMGAGIERVAGGAGPDALAALADEADAATGRYGTASYDRGAITNLIGTCQAYAGWDAPAELPAVVASPEGSDLVALLIEYYELCDGLSNGQVLWPVPGRILNSCLLLNETDPVLPPAAATAWTEMVADTVRVAHGSHGAAFFYTADPATACWGGAG